jgi:hypothetical protein
MTPIELNLNRSPKIRITKSGSTYTVELSGVKGITARRATAREVALGVPQTTTTQAFVIKGVTTLVTINNSTTWPLVVKGSDVSRVLDNAFTIFEGLVGQAQRATGTPLGLGVLGLSMNLQFAKRMALAELAKAREIPAAGVLPPGWTGT